MSDEVVSVDPSTAARMVQRLLRGVREYLGLEAAFVGEVSNGTRTFRFVDLALEAESLLDVDASDPLDEGYCGHVLAGRIPEFLSDPAAHPFAASLPVTAALPVGTHVSVPIRFSDGTVYGTFCCFSRRVEAGVKPDDVNTLRLMAELAGEYLEVLESEEHRWRQRRAFVEQVLGDPDAITMVFQPLREIETLRITGVEALARFPSYGKAPDWLFNEAADVGLGVELELVAIRAAIDALQELPAHVRLNVNVSPATLLSTDFLTLVCALPPGRLVVEVTEHAAVEDYAEVRAASERLSERGVDLAVDDVGMGFSNFNRILETDPRELKLDAVVIRGVDTNPVKQALVETFCTFGRRTGLEIVAEGIETAAELETLRHLRVTTGQGYHLGRPAPLDEVLALIEA